MKKTQQRVPATPFHAVNWESDSTHSVQILYDIDAEKDETVRVMLSVDGNGQDRSIGCICLEIDFGQPDVACGASFNALTPEQLLTIYHVFGLAITHMQERGDLVVAA